MNIPYRSIQNTYKQTQIQTASKEKLLLMAYEGAIKFLKAAQEALPKKDYETVNKYLQKAQDIVVELMLSLDMEAGGEIAKNLWNLYDYMYFRLVQANVKKDNDMIEEVKQMLESLYETWKEAIKKLQEEKKKTEKMADSDMSVAEPKTKTNLPPQGGLNIAG